MKLNTKHKHSIAYNVLQIGLVKLRLMKNENKIQELKQELLDKYNIETDRDLIRQLDIKDEDKGKLFAWIRYQCAYEYRNGWNEGREELKEQLAELLTPKRE